MHHKVTRLPLLYVLYAEQAWPTNGISATSVQVEGPPAWASFAFCLSCQKIRSNVQLFYFEVGNFTIYIVMLLCARGMNSQVGSG